MGRTAIPAEAFEHGDPRRYRRGCRCTTCKTGMTATVRRQRYLRTTGRGTRVSPQRAARHIELLRGLGMSDKGIQTEAAVCPNVFYRITQQRTHIHRDTEARLLAVKPRQVDTPRSGAHISGRGTIRRLRALAADGWPATRLGERCGKHKQFIVQLQNSDPDTTVVRRWVADYVTELSGRLAGQRPEDHGIAAHIAERVRKTAAGKGWAGTAYWDPDDYDNPGFTPATSADTKRRQQIAEDAHWIMRHGGLDRATAAQRLGVSKSYVEHAFRDHPEYKLETAA
ncbi:hypothetical protein [Streptomyces griseoloalbus]|uniref:Uncharacterized protein n=1 Tax=Streptomyces griseoloalbus TaxID=67303 RepID=A0A7W8FCE1_9ACTN|nr:hypothetical protein [Streptomyces albaduncus]MBB5130262.1 hypothetical protein [Streptomyces albaduncus]GGW81945.1 hypothetical protein GCM10010340_69890 [Streptomyces albaduncus]